MRKSIFILIIVFLQFQSGFAQRELDEGQRSFRDRLYFGGNFNLQFGSVTFIDVSPLVGYMVNERFSTGVGFTYQYLNYRYMNNFKTNVYGGRVFARHNIGEQFFALTEFESLNVENPRFIGNDLHWTREWVPGLFVGGGIFQPFGRRGGLQLAVLYNLTYVRDKSPYASPFVVRAGIML